MKNVKKVSRRVLLILFVAGVLTAALGLTSGVGAIPTEACEYTYYSDATKTTVVGGIFAACTYTQRWGIVTAHYDKECFTSCHIDDGL